jgi:hypothetical protein
VQCVIFGRALARGDSFSARSIAGQVHVDRHIAVGVAVDLDAGAMHALDPLDSACPASR